MSDRRWNSILYCVSSDGKRNHYTGISLFFTKFTTSTYFVYEVPGMMNGV